MVAVEPMTTPMPFLRFHEALLLLLEVVSEPMTTPSHLLVGLAAVASNDGLSVLGGLALAVPSSIAFESLQLCASNNCCLPRRKVCCARR